MNKRILYRSLISAGLFALVGAVGAQTYYTHELLQRVAGNDAAALPADPPVVPPTVANTLPPPDAAWNPWAAMHADMAQMQAEMDRMFQGFPGGFHHTLAGPDIEQATVTLKDDGKAYVVKAQIPGAKEDEINVNLDGRLLSISSQTQGSEEHSDGQGKPMEQAAFASTFQQAFTLPGPVNAGGMHSRYQDGVLTVTIPKAS